MTQEQRYAFIGALVVALYRFAGAAWSLFAAFMYFAWLFGYVDITWRIG